MTSLQLPLPPPLECCTTSAATELGERHRRSPPHSPSFSAPSDGERADGKACRAKRAPPRAWTEAEHAAFLAGLEAGCRHRWAELARRFVPSRTAAQVASHAQKHYLRLAAKNRRTSVEPPAVGKAWTPVVEEALKSGAPPGLACNSSAGAPTTPVRSPYPDGVDSTSSALPPLPTAPTAALALATGVPLARLIAECFSAHYQRSLLGGACPTAEELDAVKMLAGHCLRS